ncbi:protein FAM187B-like [Narcine bancroftii]|uniref:protein FAM187B-like n=1 Tax=Narcine bancroftii TaxID=1343680 RepID=UPI0038319915
MYAQTPLLLSVGLLALIGGLPRLLERDSAAPNCAGTDAGGKPCDLPFLSHNPLSLPCPAADEHGGAASVHWQHADLSQPGAQARTFAGPRGLRARRGPASQLGSRASVRAGGTLLLARARPSDSGLYLCKAPGREAPLAAYRVDVQDSALLHVSHRGLGQPPLAEQRLRLAAGGEGGGRAVRMHTRWGPWQDCDRCGTTGERKQLGFCYAALSGAGGSDDDDDNEEEEEEEPALPCGLVQLHLGQALPRRGPELRYETCRRACGGEGSTPSPPLERRALLIETLLLDAHEHARLTCPGASVYTPVTWQRDATPLTRLELLRHGPGATHRLDEASGGAAYRIAGVRPADRGVYLCWVHGRRAAAYHLELVDLPAGPRAHGRRLLAALRALLAAFALGLVVSALAEVLNACWGGGL